MTRSIETAAPGIGAADEQKHQAVSAEDVARVIDGDAFRGAVSFTDEDINVYESKAPRRAGALKSANAILALFAPSAPHDAGVVGDLVEALRPFAAVALDGRWDDGFVVDEGEGLTVGDLRKARAALAKYATQGTGGVWIEWRGGENPVPGQRVNLRQIAYRKDDTAVWDSDAQDWKRSKQGEAGDITAYRLATHQAAISTDTQAEGEQG